MSDDSTIAAHVLERYGHAVIHMRQQKEDRRFGLVIGAGASVTLGFPDWKTLLNRIARHPEVDGFGLLSSRTNSHTSSSQLLYQHYRAKHTATVGGTPDHTFNRSEATTRAGWQRIVRDALYADVPEDAAELMNRDLYLKKFLEVVRNTPLTINYNFDDSLQRMLDATPAPDKEKRRSHHTVWSANIQMFPRDGVIYHPNGYLPYRLGERSSEQLVFLEDSFADQLIDSMAGHYTVLAYHLAQATRLFIGLSLDDPTLKHLLRQNAHAHPGHFHYYVAFVKGDRDPEYEKAASEANFSVFNLITLFLTAEEMAALATLLNMAEDDFRHLAEEVGLFPQMRFLVTGVVAVGKSTVVSNFRSLRTYGEWLEPRRPGMEKDPAKVDSATIREIDAWVAKQLNLKNLAMLDARHGIHIVDRAPLDAFAFTPESQWRQKAVAIREAVSPGQSKRRLVSAHIILLTGDPDVIAVRAISNHRDTDCASLRRQQDLLKSVYCQAGSPVSVIDTRDKSIRQVVKEVARVVHLEKYAEAPLHEWLLSIERGDIHA